LGGTYAYTGATTIGSGATLQVGAGNSTGALLGSITDNGTLTMNQSGSVNINSAITGAGAFAQNGTSVLTMNTASTYQGNTYVNHGVLKLGASNVIPGATSVPGSTGWFILDGNATNAGTFDLNGFNDSVNLLQGLSGTVLGDITNSASSGTSVLTFGNDFSTGTNTYAGLVTENSSGGKIQLVKQGANINVLSAANSYSGGTIVNAGQLILQNNTAAGSGSITLNNGATLGLLPNGASIFLGNSIYTAAGATVTNTAGAFGSLPSLGNAYGGSFVSGDANSTNVIESAVSFNDPANKQFQSFAGTVLIDNGAQLRFSATPLGTNGGDNTTFEIEGTLNTRNGTPNGPGVSLGALIGSGYLTGAGNAAGSGTYIIGAKGIDSTFAGTIQDGGFGNVSIVKTGPARLTLSGTVTYTGGTTVNNGVLALVDPVSLDNSTNISLGSATAVIDVSGRGDDTLYLGNSTVQTLSGFGAINGNLYEGANSFVRAGLGTLTVSNAATFNGALSLQLNRTNANTHSLIKAASFTFAGPLTVANAGPALQGGDTFQLFSTAVSGFTATNLPTLTGNLYWTNRLAINGSIAVINPVTTIPTNIVVSVNGGNLTLSWPADHTGWYLQSQTNTLGKGIGTNWVTMPGSSTVNSVTIPINRANPAIFYRMSLNP
jgi:autotransporter-associated beta strand protein